MEAKNTEERAEFHKTHSGINSPLWKGGPDSINQYIRGIVCTEEWKKEVLEVNNYKCTVTGKNGRLNIHHLYSFNLIVMDAHQLNNIEFKKSSKLYTQEELDILTDYTKKWHNNPKNYIVINEELHRDFHKKYGYGFNTPAQFQEFVTSLNESRWL